VSELERVARHLTALSAQAASGGRASIRLSDRVRALEAARQEVADVEVAAGLYSRV
jgi:hypothetical protein